MRRRIGVAARRGDERGERRSAGRLVERLVGIGLGEETLLESGIDRVANCSLLLLGLVDLTEGKIMLCGCGCERETELATETRPRRGWVRGQPKPFLPHHSKFRHVSKDGIYKRCRECKRDKRIHDFHREDGTPDGRQRMCKECSAEQAKRYRASPNGHTNLSQGRRVFNLRSNYGLTSEAYLVMHDAQSGLCAICRKPEGTTKQGTLRRLGVDHDHRTGKVRELLCLSCNQGIARFHDDPALLEAAATYMRKHR
jgi:hypothetical protein